MASIVPSRRVRRTPFTDGVTARGVKGYTVYNRMLLPTFFDSFHYDCAHLKQHVQVWDVSCERQVAVRGPDAKALMQVLTPRDLAKMVVGQCMYIPVVDEQGGMLNDPVLVKLAEDEYWISIADSDLLLWVKAIVQGYDFNVEVWEPDISPLAVQGPKADDLMARVFGEEIRDVRFFRYGRFQFQDREFVIARSGYSKQGGFEIYVDGTDIGMNVWDALFDAGEDLNVRAGCPNLIERIEGGLLSYGNDMTDENTPYECGLGRFCNLETSVSAIGRAALLPHALTGPSQMIRAVDISGEATPVSDQAWPIVTKGGNHIGQVTSVTRSFEFNTNVAIAMVNSSHWADGTKVFVEAPDGRREAVIKEKFWI